MPSAPLPTPQYIDYETNVKPYIGTDKIAVNDTDSTAIPTALADQLIASGEALVLEDLSPYYQTVPNLATEDNLVWTDLPEFTYTTLYYMFVIQSCLKLIGNFIARNTDQKDTTLSYFQNFYINEYNTYLNRIVDKLPNGGYKYNMIGLLPLTAGINRRPQRYVATGALGRASYEGRQLTNPALNFSNAWPWRGYR